jgi:hypothetical protein
VIQISSIGIIDEKQNGAATHIKTRTELQNSSNKESSTTTSNTRKGQHNTPSWCCENINGTIHIINYSNWLVFVNMCPISYNTVVTSYHEHRHFLIITYNDKTLVSDD